MEKLLAELKKNIIEVLNLTDVDMDGIPEDAPLVGGELGIDSIDVLEMVIMIEQKYGVKIDNKELGEKVFSTLRTLTEHIHTHSPAFSK